MLSFHCTLNATGCPVPRFHHSVCACDHQTQIADYYLRSSGIQFSVSKPIYSGPVVHSHIHWPVHHPCTLTVLGPNSLHSVLLAYTKPRSSTLFTKLGSLEDPMVFFCNFSTVWCGRLLKICFLGFWNYNSVIQALLVSNILCLFISTEVSQ